MGGEDPLEKKMETTAVFLPGESHEQRSLVGYSAWGHKESDSTDRLSMQHAHMVATSHRGSESH